MPTSAGPLVCHTLLVCLPTSAGPIAAVYLPTSSGRETPVGVVLRNTGLPHNSTRTRRQEHGPARTSIICSSAPEPLLALGVGVPEPPSPGERFCTPGPPWRAPPPGCQKVVVGRQAPINSLRMVYTMIWPAAGAAHGVLHARKSTLRCNANRAELCALLRASRCKGEQSCSNRWTRQSLARHGSVGCISSDRVADNTVKHDSTARVTAHLLSGAALANSAAGQHEWKTVAR